MYHLFLYHIILGRRDVAESVMILWATLLVRRRNKPRLIIRCSPYTPGLGQYKIWRNLQHSLLPHMRPFLLVQALHIREHCHSDLQRVNLPFCLHSRGTLKDYPLVQQPKPSHSTCVSVCRKPLVTLCYELCLKAQAVAGRFWQSWTWCTNAGWRLFSRAVSSLWVWTPCWPCICWLSNDCPDVNSSPCIQRLSALFWTALLRDFHLSYTLLTKNNFHDDSKLANLL